MTKEEMLKEIETLKEKVEKLDCGYPKYMLAIDSNYCNQYTVEFTGLKKGSVVASSTDGAHKVEFYSINWIPHTDTEVWKEVTNPDELCDKDLIECWDNLDTHKRELKFYDAKNNRTFMFDGCRYGIEFDNYRKLMPWEEAIHPWVEETRKTLKD